VKERKKKDYVERKILNEDSCFAVDPFKIMDSQAQVSSLNCSFYLEFTRINFYFSVSYRFFL
jgi:hypothetical protein